MPDNNPSRKQPRFTILAVTLFCVAASIFAWRALAPPSASRFVHLRAAVSQAVRSDGAWYWLEGAGTPAARLMTSSGGEAREIVSGEAIRSFAVGEKQAAWIASGGKAWTVSTVPVSGGAPRVVHTGSSEAAGICIANHKLWWLESVPAAVPGAATYPPLGPTLRLVSAPLDGGDPTSVCPVMEAIAGDVMGVHSGTVYLSAKRAGPLTLTAFYRAPESGGLPARIAAETGEHRGLLTPDGTLYWTAASREASQTDKSFCVRRLTPAGQTQTLEDWLPDSGTLYSSGGAVFYIDGSIKPAVWRIGRERALPEPSPLPAGFSAIAAGDNEVLLTPSPVGSEPDLYRSSLQ